MVTHYLPYFSYVFTFGHLALTFINDFVAFRVELICSWKVIPQKGLLEPTLNITCSFDILLTFVAFLCHIDYANYKFLAMKSSKRKIVLEMTIFGKIRNLLIINDGICL